jgi:hypothetical protein
MSSPQVALFNYEEYPHFTVDEWSALKRLHLIIGEGPLKEILKYDQEAQKASVRAFMVTEARNNVAASSPQVLLTSPTNQGSRFVKIDAGIYKGEEGESLLRWFTEMDLSIFARQIMYPELQVAYAMSRLSGRAKSWAFGKRMAEAKCFPTYDSFKSELKAAFQPPKCEFRSRSRFLAISQGKRNLHDYVQEVRFLVASIVSAPIDNATQVSVFLSGLREGPVRTQLFREYPETLEDAISSALQEDFSQKQSKTEGTNYPRTPQGRAKPHGGPEAMDLSSIEAKGEGGSQGRSSKCHRCQKPGHFAYECRAPAPEGNNRRTGQGQQRSRLAPGSKNGNNR